METISLNSWSEFAPRIQEIRDRYGVSRRPLPSGDIYEGEVDILFRGQSKSHWPLRTTLERRTSCEFDVSKYVAYASLAVHEIEAFTGTKWGLPDRNLIFSEIREKQTNAHPYFPQNVYPYLVHLRHHGFPSPLLDWTESPFIAAYFAYLEDHSEERAVYCFIERPNLSKGGSIGSPHIHLMGPYVSTHKRHFSQKASYTVSARWDYKTGAHIFCPHEQIFERNNTHQDLLIKLLLPSSSRIEALRSLNDYNLNHFTLFHSEEALLRTLETKYFDLNEGPRYWG